MSHYPNRQGYPPAGPPPGRLPQRPPPHHHHGMPPPPPGFIPGYLPPPPPPGMHGPPPGMHSHSHPHPPPHMPPRSNSGGPHAYRMTPPPPHAGYRGPPGVPGAPYYGGGGARSAPPPPPAPVAAHVPGFTHDELDRMSRVFVGNISSGVDDAWMDRILGACGPIKEWKRMRNPDGGPKGFGFVTFADPDAVVRALDLIGGEAMPGKQPIELPSMDRTPWKRLLIKLDESARKLLDRYRATRGVRPNDANIDGHARARLFELLDNLRGVAPPPPESRDVEKLVPTPEPTAAAILPTPAPPGLPSLDDMAIVSTKLRDTPSAAGSATPRPVSRTPSMQSLPMSDTAAAIPPPPPTAQQPAPRRSRWDLGNRSKSPAPKPATPTTVRAPAAPVLAPAPKPRATFVEVEEGEVPAAASTGPVPLLKLKSKGFMIKKPGISTTSSNGRSSPASGAAARVSFDADGDADEHVAKRTRLIPLKRITAAPAESVDAVLGASIKWENWTSEAKEQVQTVVLRAVAAFLGADDNELSEYVVMAVDGRTSAQDLVVDLGDVFAEDTNLFVASVWKAVVDATS
ncbi:hypothetical protein AMAG_01111 [Allomyces macrogynus ATCC 38327]|uniref:RRM domain-containing protein n=1 Tax=Allomyces macrogynus (strain ATCC 38327) TaxID=578462 RepID=A0A0L0RYG2_ALLM3|nr:hypothetical protein AMAG_01111 [Allomyces macrogynus ATCC 38327]|eukprot:KNE55195.1 hypothetical protein AMAG_01111 [Allomyces macrogynus ATCC 38327]